MNTWNWSSDVSAGQRSHTEPRRPLVLQHSLSWIFSSLRCTGVSAGCLRRFLCTSTRWYSFLTCGQNHFGFSLLNHKGSRVNSLVALCSCDNDVTLITCVYDTWYLAVVYSHTLTHLIRRQIIYPHLRNCSPGSRRLVHIRMRLIMLPLKMDSYIISCPFEEFIDCEGGRLISQKSKSMFPLCKISSSKYRNSIWST